jgi:hypothetical protein
MENNTEEMSTIETAEATAMEEPQVTTKVEVQPKKRGRTPKATAPTPTPEPVTAEAEPVLTQAKGACCVGS